MNKIALIMPLLTAVLGACGSTSPMMRNADDSTSTLRVEPVVRITNGVAPEEAAYQMGRQHLAAHRFDLAIAEFAQALAINPKLTNAYVGVGVAQSMANRQSLAVAAFNEAIARDPNNPQWHANLGMAHARSARFESARLALARAWALAPGNQRIEAQYQRVSETAMLARMAAEREARRQAEVAASGMTIIAADGESAGMRQVGTRVYELSLQQPVAASQPVAVVNPLAETAVPLAAAGSTTATAATTVDADKTLPAVGSFVQVLATGTMEPVLMADASPVGASPSSAAVSPPTRVDAAPVATPPVEAAATVTEPADETLPLVYQAPVKSAKPAGPMNEATPADRVSEADASTQPTTKASAETGLNVAASTESEVRPAAAPDSAFSSPEEALQLARQRLFERRLAAARIRAARTAMIGVEEMVAARSAATR